MIHFQNSNPKYVLFWNPATKMALAEGPLFCSIQQKFSACLEFDTLEQMELEKETKILEGYTFPEPNDV